jgi:hypothetical protein
MTNPEDIFSSIVERFEAIKNTDRAQMRRDYRRLKLRQGLRADAEFKGVKLTDAQLDTMTDDLLKD